MRSGSAGSGLDLLFRSCYVTYQEIPMARPVHYPSSRYQPSPLVDFGARAARERLSPPALKAFFNIMARWNLRDEDARALLGGVSNGPFYEMKRNPDRMLDAPPPPPISYLPPIFTPLVT